MDEKNRFRRNVYTELSATTLLSPSGFSKCLFPANAVERLDRTSCTRGQILKSFLFFENRGTIAALSVLERCRALRKNAVKRPKKNFVKQLKNTHNIFTEASWNVFLIKFGSLTILVGRILYTKKSKSNRHDVDFFENGNFFGHGQFLSIYRVLCHFFL